MSYPKVLNEFTTLDAVLAGKSLARYGDGEMKLADGRSGIRCQHHDPELALRLREILHDSGECLVGIPSMDPRGEKYDKWEAFFRSRPGVKGLAKYFKSGRIYHSAFVSRPDSAPYVDVGYGQRDSVLNVPEYWARVRRLWEGRKVTLVRGSSKSFTGELLVEHGSGPVTEIIAPRQHAWFPQEAMNWPGARGTDNQGRTLRDRLGDADYVLLCLGPTATVIATELCAEGRQAVDIGILGMFFKKHLKGQPMWVTAEDKVA